jgi:hypothetical protein
MPGSNFHEYSKPTVASNGCNYANLADYNQNYFGRGGVGAPQLSAARSNQVVVLPSFGGKGYQLGQSQGQSCTGFMNLKGAYPNASNGACGAFTSNLCG